jgi:hypothetical protein
MSFVFDLNYMVSWFDDYMGIMCTFRCENNYLIVTNKRLRGFTIKK